MSRDQEAVRPNMVQHSKKRATEKRPTRLLLVDSQCLTRQALRQLMLAMPGIGSVDESPFDELLSEHLHRLTPDLTIINLGTDTHSKIDAVRRLRESSPEQRLMVIVTRPCAHCVEALTRLGVRGLMTTWSDSDELRQAITTVLGDERYLGADLSAHALHNNIASSPVDVHLSPRQRQILDLIGAGRSVREIAARLQISAKTVETHRARMQQLLGLQGAKALLGYALRMQQHGLSRTSKRESQVRKNPTSEAADRR